MDAKAYGSLSERVWELLREAPAPHLRGVIMHLDTVAMLCELIGLKRGLDAGICRSAGLLHDVWLFSHMPMDVETHRQHGYIGSEFAKDLLTANGGYSDGEIEIICRMIYNHNDKGEIHDEYSETLKDADSLQHYLNGSEYDKRYNYGGRDRKVLDEFMIDVK